MTRLTLYSRPECELCEKLLDDLVPMLGQRADVDVVDITEDPALLLEYGPRIPVLSAGNVELSAYPLDKARVEAYLQHTARA